MKTSVHTLKKTTIQTLSQLQPLVILYTQLMSSTKMSGQEANLSCPSCHSPPTCPPSPPPLPHPLNFPPKSIRVMQTPNAATKEDDEMKSHLAIWRTALIASGQYLGVRQTVHAVQWMRDGQTLRLIACNSDAIRPGPVPVIRQVGGDTGESVSLSLLVQLTEDDFWMMPDAFWRGPAGGACKFADIKLTCTGAPVQHAPLPDDFDTALHMLEELMDAAKSNAIREGVIKSNHGMFKLRFRHQPFHVSSYTAATPIHLLHFSHKQGAESHSGDDSSDPQRTSSMCLEFTSHWRKLQLNQQMKCSWWIGLCKLMRLVLP